MRFSLGALRRVLVAALVVVGMIGIAACGSSDDNGGTSSGSSSSGSSSSASGGGETVKVGAIFPLTGPYAAAGTQSLRGMEAAVKYLNEGGSTSGHKYELLKEDDQGDPTKTALAARKLSTSGITMGVAAVTPGAAGAVVQVFTPAKILFGGPNTPEFNPADLTADGKFPLVFGSGPSVPQYSEAQFRYAKEELGAKKVGQIYSSDPVGEAFNGSAQAAAKKYGLELVSKSFQPTQKDVTGQLRSLQDSGAEVLAVWAYGTPLISVLQSLSKMGWDVPIVTVQAGGDPAVVSLLKDQAPEILDNMAAGPLSLQYIADQPGEAPKNDAAKGFAKYYAELKGKPLDASDLAVGALTYDSMIGLDRAIGRAKSTDVEKIADAMSAEPPIELSQGPASWPQQRDQAVSIDEMGLYQPGSDASSGTVLAPTPKK
jgi:branched-chain amino acid transport system substrate-binding protein